MELCINWTLNKVLNVGNLCEIDLYRPSTCLIQTENFVLRRSDLDRFYSTCITTQQHVCDWYMLVIIDSYSSPYWRSGIFSTSENLISGVMVSKLAPSVVDLGFETRSSRTKDYKICICCFSTKHAALRSKRKDWLDRNPNYMCEWGHMSIRRLLF